MSDCRIKRNAASNDQITASNIIRYQIELDSLHSSPNSHSQASTEKLSSITVINSTAPFIEDLVI